MWPRIVARYTAILVLVAGCSTQSGVQLAASVSDECKDLGVISAVAKSENDGIEKLRSEVERIGGNTLVEAKSNVVSIITHRGTEVSGRAYACPNRRT